jgi:hypothetical protein
MIYLKRAKTLYYNFKQMSNFMMNQGSIRLCNYFDKLINRLDLVVETAIRDNYHDKNLENEFNKQRNEFIKEIREVEAYNLTFISNMNLKPGKVLTDKDLFSKFCFFIEFLQTEKKQVFNYDDLVSQEIGLRLIATDKYLTEGQIKYFENLFNYTCTHQDRFCSYPFFNKQVKSSLIYLFFSPILH